MWWNWQTRKIQVLMPSKAYRFKSCHPHQNKADTVVGVRFVLIWIVKVAGLETALRKYALLRIFLAVTEDFFKANIDTTVKCFEKIKKKSCHLFLHILKAKTNDF